MERLVGILRNLTILLLASAALLAGQTIPSADEGLLRVYEDLRQLKTTARILQVTAHPDDEDGGLLTMEARGRGVEVRLMTLTRGEGGQNKFGGETGDELGIIRTLELLEADRYYGISQRFARTADFGFSKTAEETLDKWGHDTALADLVREIRTFQPDVLIARFSGTTRDGHGNHQASGILTREAFEAAGDPKRFPEQLAIGLKPWRPLRLLMGLAEADDPSTLKFDTGTYSPLLGMSFAQYALEGLSHQISQGVGGLRLPAGHRFTYYRIEKGESVSPAVAEDALAGIDASVPSLASRLSDPTHADWLRQRLTEFDRLVRTAESTLNPNDPAAIAETLVAAEKIVDDVLSEASKWRDESAGADYIRSRMTTKREQLSRAIEDALGLWLEATIDSGQPPYSPRGFPAPQNTLQVATPGESVGVVVRIVNRGSQAIRLDRIRLSGPGIDPIAQQSEKSLKPGDDLRLTMNLTLPDGIPLTRPYWHRSDPQNENVVTVDGQSEFAKPLGPLALQASAVYEFAGASLALSEHAVQTKTVDPTKGQLSNALVIGPSLSVGLEPAAQVMTTNSAEGRSLEVGVTSYAKGATEAKVQLKPPQGWTVNPASQTLQFKAEGEHQTCVFEVHPRELKEQHYTVETIAEADGHRYSEEMRLVGRPDIGRYPFYRPAVASVSAVNVRVPPGLKIGYIMGAGDDIPIVLRQLGLSVEEIEPAELERGDLSRFDTIILGIRAYDVRPDVRASRDKLMEFARHGGTVLMQNNQGTSAASLLPYPATGGTERVSVEDASVKVLQPENAAFHFPNEVTRQDWDHWVQERGLNFLKSWDEHFTPLLSMSDPGEQPLQGGLLVAPYGKGRFIYTGLAFARQLPAGVPGAIRLYVNLLSIGHQR